MAYIDVVKEIAKHVGIDIQTVKWLTFNADGIENISSFELFWLGLLDGKPATHSKILNKSELPQLFEKLILEARK